jgi:hypothetical protein
MNSTTMAIPELATNRLLKKPVKSGFESIYIFIKD